MSVHKSIVPCLTEFPGISSLSVHTSIDTLVSGASPETVEGAKLFPYMVSKVPPSCVSAVGKSRVMFGGGR